MGAPIRTSSDVPDFSTYPSSPSDQSLSAHGATPMPVFDARYDAANPLQQVAKEVGSRLGEGMNVVQRVRDRVLDRIESLRASFDQLYCSVRDRSTDVAQEKFDHLREGSREQLLRAKHYAEARPLAVIAAAGLAGVLLGAGVRAWRGNRG
ncbi:MAG: hypothetical protein ABIP81_08935 [Terriglobales bacterium]